MIKADHVEVNQGGFINFVSDCCVCVLREALIITRHMYHNQL